MKKGVIFGGIVVIGGIAAYLFNKGNKKSQEIKKEMVSSELHKIDEEDYIDILRKNDPLSDFKHRRALYVMARVIDCDCETEEGQEKLDDFVSYFHRLNYEKSWEEITVEVNKIPEYSEEAGKRTLRLFILLGKSRDAFFKDSVKSDRDGEEIDETFELIQELDNLIEKWGI